MWRLEVLPPPPLPLHDVVHAVTARILVPLLRITEKQDMAVIMVVMLELKPALQ
jgi:hypothetical protein